METRHPKGQEKSPPPPPPRTIKGKVSTCSYTLKCSVTTCAADNDFTDVMVKDVLIAGLADEEVKKDVLGWQDLDRKTLEETVSFIEAKEMV